MRMELPRCNLKTCLMHSDGNCTSKLYYERCYYTELKNALTTDPVKHGRWKDGKVRGSFAIVCSCCGSSAPIICPLRYCPECGAKMDLKEEEE